VAKTYKSVESIHFDSAAKFLGYAIWDSIVRAPDALELTQGQKDELDRRLTEFEADPDSGATLEEVFARIRHAS
jgi:putative addiction module component (TIGR02574 family)